LPEGEHSVVRITIVVNNTAGDTRLRTEHGLAMWIQAGGLNILFDTGQGQALMANARVLGLPLAQTDLVVLSHGHYDHTGAVAEVLAVAPAARLIVHPGAVVPRYALRPGQAPAPIGMPGPDQAAIDRLPLPQITWAVRPLALTSAIGVTGPIARITDFEDTGGPFFLDSQGQRADAIADDQALWLKTDKGLVICVGCSHAGIVNTLDQVARLNPDVPIHAVIGGLHLLGAGNRRLCQTMDRLDLFSPTLLAPCHCTGQDAIQALKRHFGPRLAPAHAGAVFLF